MKITMDLDCTPEEARTFLGLPDVKPMQDQILREMHERMAASVRAMQPDEMMRLWMPATLPGFEQMQEFFTRMARPKSE